MTNCVDVRTKVSLSVGDALDFKAKAFGLTRNEYVRFLILKDTEKEVLKFNKLKSKNLPSNAIEGDD